jgi:hypothetical protein
MIRLIRSKKQLRAFYARMKSKIVPLQTKASSVVKPKIKSSNPKGKQTILLEK